MNKREILTQYPPAQENVLQILHHLQNNNPRHYLSGEDLELAAEYLNLTRGVIYGIATYYSMFSLKPRGRHIIRICDSPVCHVFEAGSLIDELTHILEIDAGQTTADGLFTLELTECIGCCDEAPAMMINGDTFGHLTGKKISALIDRIRKREN
jgi:NADH-quinone oxidoreductase subunit E